MSTAPSCTLLSRPRQVAAQATRRTSAVSPGRYQSFPQDLLRNGSGDPPEMVRLRAIVWVADRDSWTRAVWI